MQNNPFVSLPIAWQKRFMVVLAGLAIMLLIVLQVIDVPLRTAVAPSGIVSFELAGDAATAQTMVASWDETARIHAGISLGIDYLFMASYAGAISLCCALVARSLKPGWLASIGMALAWGQWLAAALDALENVALIRILLGARGAFWPLLARWCAIPKFALVVCGLSFIGAGFVLTRLLRRERSPGDTLP